MLGRLQKWILIVCLLGISGGQWAIVRTVAWTQMTIQNSQNLSTWDAIAKTLDGSAPCKICLWLAEEQKDQQTPIAFAYSQFLQDCLVAVNLNQTSFPPQIEPFARSMDLLKPQYKESPQGPPPRFYIG